MLYTLIERTKETLDTLSTEYAQQILLALLDDSRYVSNAGEQSCIMAIMRGISMPIIEYDPKATMYHAYDTLHRLRTVSENKVRLIRYPSE